MKQARQKQETVEEMIAEFAVWARMSPDTDPGLCVCIKLCVSIIDDKY